MNTIGSTGDSQNQNGAISMSRAQSQLRDLEAGRDAAYLGWQLTVLDASSLADLVGARPDHSGKMPVVFAVDSNSPAEKAKLVPGDTIGEIDGTPVATVADTCEILSSHSSGDRLTISGETFLGRYLRYKPVHARLK
jgi:S1-C subfamily serine protease